MIYEPTDDEILRYGGSRSAHLNRRNTDPSLCGSITRGIGYRNLAGRMASISQKGTDMKIVKFVNTHFDTVPRNYLEEVSDQVGDDDLIIRKTTYTKNGYAGSYPSFLEMAWKYNGSWENVCIRGYMNYIAVANILSNYANVNAGDEFYVIPGAGKVIHDSIIALQS